MAAPKVYQGGQKVLSTVVATDRVQVDNGGPVGTVAPMSVLAAFVTSKTGTFTLNGATPVTVADANIDAGSIVIPTLKTVGGTVGALPAIQTITPGVGFTVAGTALDTSIYNYVILN